MVESPITLATADPRIEIPTLVKGEAMAAVTLPAASGGSGEASYTLQPEVPGLQFDAATRVLSGTPTEAGMHRMTYTATAGDGDATTLRFTIAVVDGLSFGAQTVATKSFAQATTIEPVTLPEAAGGSGTLTYALTPNVPGLLFDSATRELSGTPTTADTWSMTYQVTDGAGDMASLNFAITVLGFASELIPDLPVLPDLSAEVDAAIDGVELPQATGGHGALVYSLQPEIPGLRFDPVSRMLSGTPTEAGEYSMTYAVTDARSTVVARPFTISVLPSIRGTWRTTDRWDDDVAVTDTLTFTKDRFIFHRAYYRGGVFDDYGSSSGTWQLSGDGTIIRVIDDDHDGDDATPPIVTRTPKSYRWKDDTRDRLLMTEWNWVEADWVAEYERVPDALPQHVVGTWTQVNLTDPDVTTITLNADGSMRFHSIRPGRWEYMLSAQWTHDVVNRLIVMSDVASVGPLDVSDLYIEGDGTPRLAYAATHVPGQIIVSGWWNEPGGYLHHEGNRFGGYYHIFDRD